MAAELMVELEQWWWSSCHGSGARAMVVELADARAMCAARAMGVAPRTKLVELVRCSSSSCNGRGACAMAVELKQWRWSCCNGGGAHAMVVELVNARAMLVEHLKGNDMLYFLRSFCVMVVSV